MNYIRHLSAVFEKMDNEDRVTPYLISLYMALFRRWNENFFNNPISIARCEIMRLSKIGSTNTYIRSLRELDHLGFIKYNPSRSKHRGSLIYMFTFDKTEEQDVRPYKNNYKTSSSQSGKKNENQNFLEMSNSYLSGFGPDIPPMLQHVQIYFEEKGMPSIEADKFFNYYESNGWLVGGKSEMKDWKAAARNWILNRERFNNRIKNTKKKKRSSKPSSTNLNQNKNYNTPL